SIQRGKGVNIAATGRDATAKVLLEMLARLLQTPKRFFFACKIVANAKNYFFPFARLLQAPKRFFFACKIVASTKNYFFLFARLLQAPKTTFSHLQDCCKHFQKHYDRCSALLR
ncbi:MAG: hypothetical protein D8B51_01215, partial [Tannerella sp.]